MNKITLYILDKLEIDLGIRMSKIRLIALDLDGTLLEGDKSILPELKKVLIDLGRRGVKITTASGRYLENQLEILSLNDMGIKVGVPHALIANEQEIYIASANQYVPLIEHNSMVEREWIKIMPIVLDLLKETLDEFREKGIEVNPYDENAIERHMAGLLFKDIEEARKAEQYLRNKIMERGLKLKCCRSWCLVLILLPFAGKGEAVKTLAEYWNIEYPNVLCIGDDDHDIEMLDGRYGFISATVSNADREVIDIVKNIGGYISKLPRGRGVLDVFRYFSLIP